MIVDKNHLRHFVMFSSLLFVYVFFLDVQQAVHIRRFTAKVRTLMNK